MKQDYPRIAYSDGCACLGSAVDRGIGRQYRKRRKQGNGTPGDRIIRKIENDGIADGHAVGHGLGDSIPQGAGPVIRIRGYGKDIRIGTDAGKKKK